MSIIEMIIAGLLLIFIGYIITYVNGYISLAFPGVIVIVLSIVIIIYIIKFIIGR